MLITSRVAKALSSIGGLSMCVANVIVSKCSHMPISGLALLLAMVVNFL